jgi:hypothetical protein
MRLNRTPSSLSLLITLLLLSLFGLSHFANGSMRYIDLFIIVFTVITMNILSASKNFILVLTITLSTGFAFLFYSFFNDSTISSQVNFIIQHVLLTACLIIIWLIFSTVKNYQEDITDLKKRISELEKFEGSLSLLTNSEFVNRTQIISTGTKRRGEVNYYIFLTLSTSGVTKESMNHVLSQALLETVRAQFDLVTKLSNGSYLVFLQNTNENGCLIVVNRLFQSLRKNLGQNALPVTYTIVKEDEVDGVERITPNKESELA